jgi:glycosyltransferase involved in cell wall biosynthesis
VKDKYASFSSAEVESTREELGLAGRFVIGNFSRLHEEKGQRFLIEAVARLKSRFPALAAVIVGDGPQRGALARQIETSGLGDAVRLLGWRRDAMRLMAAVDCVVQPTLQEAFSQVMAEALWMHKPLVISDVSGAADVVRDGENGLIVPKGDVAALAAAIERLLTDGPLRDRLVTAGRAFVEEHLAIEHVIQQYEAVYERAMRLPAVTATTDFPAHAEV